MRNDRNLPKPEENETVEQYAEKHGVSVEEALRRLVGSAVVEYEEKEQRA